MIPINKDILVEFFNELIIKQDYFECHEIMEEAWKEKDNFSKTDAEVFIVLIVTGEYHYRRDNIIGATTSYKRALKLYKAEGYDLSEFGFNDNFIDKLQKRYQDIAKKSFVPMHYPVQDWVWEALYQAHDSEFDSFSQFMTTMLANFETNVQITHKHSMRDRSDVIQKRLEALNNKVN